MGSLNPMLLVSVAVMVVGTCLLIVSVATPAWTVLPKTKSLSDGLEIGVFKICSQPKGYEVCFSKIQTHPLADVPYKTVKALTVIGLLCSFGALLVLTAAFVLPLIGKNQISGLPTAAIGLAGGAFGFTICGVIMWEAMIHGDFKAYGATYGYSFALSIVGAILQVVGGVLGYIGSNRIEQPISDTIILRP